MARKLIVLGGIGLAALTAVLAGCNSSQTPEAPTAIPSNNPPTSSPTQSEEHGHKPGTHGGMIVPLGRDSYHIEVVFAKEGTIRLHTLGKNEAVLQEVDIQELTGYVKPLGSMEATEMKFTAQPQKGDAAGKTTLFVGTIPLALQGKIVEVTINNIQIGGERFRIGFTNEKSSHEEVPAGNDEEEAKRIFLTPGGKYTAADIQANGNTIPAQKYKGIATAHNSKPSPGDRICPVSKSKSNPKLTWIVGGKTYEFCCLPCIEEFVQTAKEKPNEILEPMAYIKK